MFYVIATYPDGVKREYGPDATRERALARGRFLFCQPFSDMRDNWTVEERKGGSE